ncbi:hypothetical protein BGZ61DRAFT_515092 [Ilyonectria robusta]|uniref:uncharacterized protein n=1 Tax=Ilyonectria robusta TaxID=1079257 RepID=UPI001E8E0B63|nr:uncharacterized protein BGZ61DRAFT_515092 [Ilyonectria robusta]KAH8733870.1 hypothetical protein BGZ61DRAFT_515092 [Ilyonectria robusta]
MDVCANGCGPKFTTVQRAHCPIRPSPAPLDQAAGAPRRLSYCRRRRNETAGNQSPTRHVSSAASKEQLACPKLTALVRPRAGQGLLRFWRGASAPGIESSVFGSAVVDTRTSPGHANEQRASCSWRLQAEGWPVRLSGVLGEFWDCVPGSSREVVGAKDRLKQAAHWSMPGFPVQTRCGRGS